MPAPQPVQVDVVIFDAPGQPNNIGFRLQSGIFSNGMLNFRNNGNPGFIVNFEIVNQAPAAGDFRFADTVDQALWVKPIVDPADSCPNGPCTWTQFEAQAVTGNGKRLIVRNRNEFTQRFGFVLGVTLDAAGGQPFVRLDPIGNNQNGPQT